MTQPHQDEAQAESATSVADLRPLTSRNSKGDLYERSEEVQAQIRAALDIDADALLKRARIRDYTDPEYLREECLVYFIRDYAVEDGLRTRQVLSQLSKELLGRFAKYLNSRLKGLENHADRTEAFDAVVATIFEEVADLGSGKGDFLQVRFWVRLKRLATDAFRKRSDLVKVRQRHDSLEELAERKGSADGVSTNDPLEDEEAVSPSDHAGWGDLEHQVLSHLDEPERTVYILRHKKEWLIETKKEGEPTTISEYFDVTPRTIRRWLSKAEEQIESWKKQHSEAEQSWKT